MYSVWSFFTKRSRFSAILIATILFLGISAIVSIPKESTPEVNVPIAVVSTVLPGASPEDIESLVTNVLEEPLKSGLSSVRNITSVSGEGASSITVEFEASADIDKSMRDVRDTVDAAKSELPEDAFDPRIIEIDFGGDPVVTATLSANIPSELLYRLGEAAADELETVQGVSSVTVSGVEKRQVTVVIDTSALKQRGLTVVDVTRALASANTAAPVGSIEVSGATFPVRLTGDIAQSDEVANIPILALGGAPVYIRDIARVVDGRAEPTSLSRTSIDNAPSNQAVTFEVFKSSTSKITKVSAATQAKFAELTAVGGLLEGMDISVVYDNGELLQEDLATLTRSGVQTVMLVTLVLLLAVGWREALIAAVSIPLSFLTAFIFLEYSGNTLNFVSLFALILSIGVIVDSTIVIVEGINRRLHELSRGENESAQERTETKANAALDVVRRFHVPLTTGTLTTVAVFAPLLMISGITGEFIKSIPFTIIFVLLSSLLVALGFVPLFAAKMLRREVSHSAFAVRRDAFIARVEAWYKERLENLLASKESGNVLMVTLLVLFVLSMMLPAFGAVRVVFFEDSNSDYVVVETQLPVGSVLAQTDIEIRKAEEVLYSIPEATSFVTTVGRSSAFTDPFAGSSGSARFANIFINLDQNRNRETTEILDDIRTKLAPITTSTMRVDQLSDGPPSLAPITITLYSDSLTDLEVGARVVETTLQGIDGTSDVTSSVKDNTSEFVFTIKRDEVVSLGADIRTIASTLRTALQGETVTEIKKLGEDIDIVVRLALDAAGKNALFNTNATTIDALSQVMVTTPRGQFPLSTFVDVSVEPSRAAIRHDDAQRIATVSSRLALGGNALNVTQELKRALKDKQLPESVAVKYGGESEDIDQSFKDMFTALIIGLISMFGILVLQFNSFRYAAYVLSIVPLSLIGVFVGLMITGSPLSFPSIMGFIALSGIVVNNSIILIDSIHTERRMYGASKTIREIVVSASASRLRPVLLTALTTVIGVVPLLFAAAIWIPLAYALMFGLAFSTIITLLLVPAIYARWPGQ